MRRPRAHSAKLRDIIIHAKVKTWSGTCLSDLFGLLLQPVVAQRVRYALHPGLQQLRQVCQGVKPLQGVYAYEVLVALCCCQHLHVTDSIMK